MSLFVSRTQSSSGDKNVASSQKTPLKIAVDVRSILSKKTGKEWYTFSLLEKMLEQDNLNTYYLYSRYDFDERVFPKNCQKRIINKPLWMWHFSVLRDMYRQKIDVYLATASYIIASLACIKKIKIILTVHDLVAFLFPDKHDKKALIIEKLTTKIAVKKSHFIICPSRNTQKDLERLFPSTQGKTFYIPEAARSIFQPITDGDKENIILSKYALPQKYILNIGTLSPRKNIVLLLKAYAKLSDTLKSIYPLVLVGKKGWYYKEIFDIITQLNIEHNVFFTGYVDDYDLPYVLDRAEVFIYPSKYEGFGLPLLEAMACKVPVISSDTYALLEVAKGCSEIVKRKDTDDIYRGLKKVLEDKNYQQELITKGFEKSQKYSWDMAARETLRLIETIS